MKQHRRSDADAIAVDRGNDRDFAFREGAQQPPHRDVIVAWHRIKEIGEVVSGGEILAFAADRDDPRFTVFPGAGDCVGERGVHGHGDRIPALRPIERDGEDSAAAFDPHMLAHAFASRIG